MKNLKFWSLLMALVFGLSFGVTSCGDDKDESDGSSYVEDDVIAKGQAFYRNSVKLVESKGTDAQAILDMVSAASEYKQHKSDKEWTANYLAGIAMEKYGVTDKALAKSAEYQEKVSAFKNILDAGFTAENIANVLTSLATAIGSK